MSKTITVGELRQVIKNLPDTAFVLFSDPMHSNQREGEAVSTLHDGRYGPVLEFKIGGMAAQWDQQSHTDFDHDTESGKEPDTDIVDTEELVDDIDIDLDRIIQERLDKRGTKAKV